MWWCRRPASKALWRRFEHQKSDYLVVRRFDAEVNHGAVLLEGPSGRKVLKVLPPTESLAPQFNTARSTAAVRPSGYPAPRYEAIEEYGDGTYVLMPALPATSVISSGMGWNRPGKYFAQRSAAGRWSSAHHLAASHD